MKQSGEFTDGTYTETAKGKNGKIADVDAVSGATVTSDGIKDAVVKCLQDASAE